MSWFLLALKKYATFSGRSRRREYWFFVLFYLIIVIGCAVVDAVLGTFSETSEIGLFSGLAALGLLIPSIAVTARRLHDTGKSGWWQLIAFIPLIGGLVLLVFVLKDSFPAENTYGPNPKSAA